MVNYSSEHKETKDVNKTIVATISHNGYKFVLLNNQSWDIWWIESKAKIIESKLMKSTKDFYHALMINYISKTMDLMD